MNMIKKILWFILGAGVGVAIPIVYAIFSVPIVCKQPSWGNALQIVIIGIATVTCFVLRKRRPLFFGVLLFIIPSTCLSLLGWGRHSCYPRIHDEVTPIYEYEPGIVQSGPKTIDQKTQPNH